jgi:DNA polymerase-3 subunit delta
MARSAKPAVPPMMVFYGEEDFARSRQLSAAVDELLPPSVDRSMALCAYDGSASEEQGGPTLAAVMDDLMTLPFLADRRVVVVRDADKFIAAHRERLERWVTNPSPTGVLLLECRSFPKTTRLYKAAAAAGCRLVECARLSARAAPDYVIGLASEFGKRMDRSAAAQLCDLLGPDQGLLAGEVEKLALYIGDRPTITPEDVREMVGQTREEKIFAVMDAAGVGDLKGALRMWRQVLATDPEAVFRAVGGIAFVVRKWISAQEMRLGGAPVGAIAPKVMMWGRERELQNLLDRLDLPRMKQLLHAVAELDTQSKSGQRTIENGVESLLVAAAGG